MTKQIFMNLLMVVVSLLSTRIVLAQTCECPIKDAEFKDFSLQKFSHHDPEQSAIIISQEYDSVRSILPGTVRKILVQSDRNSVIVALNDTTAVSYSGFSKLFVKEGDVLSVGDDIGLAAKNTNGEFEIGFAYRAKLRSINPESILKCRK
ncbi:MAG: hypothetical protein QM762_13230 [Chryseolinea sp.]